MRVLVIGGTGFIGAHVIRRLIEMNHAVAVFARGSTQANTPTTTRSIIGERQNLSDSLSSFRGFAPDVVIDLLAYTYRKLAQSCDDLVYNYEKILVERVVMNDAQTPGTVLRLPAVYGPGDKQHRFV
jgi:nucleoside-diphosphate-sugar epimerase